ncbi:alpha/beta hydrolase [Streptomyces sp. ODS28]|uniref:alpha/beta fold hydrolase n=1 Tax=Streptomyces sp. ODS28 TaxID=3136688 RepID=UPI0031E78945
MPASSTAPVSPTEDALWRLPDRVRVSGGEVAAGVFGDGPPVVLVHGTPAWSYLWRGVVPQLARTHRVFVWDMLGFGDSRTAPHAVPSIAEQARTLAELVRHWGLENPALVGHDIGGGVVVRAHLLHHVPARALALLDAAVLGPWNTPFTEHQQRYAEAYRTMPADVFADLIATRMRTATHRPMSAETAEAYLAPWYGEAGQGRWVDQVEAVGHHDTREAVERLGHITAPTLVLWGAEDTWLPAATADRLAAAIPAARRETVPGAGHFLPEDAPRETAAALGRFLAGIGG